jgi:hypothetical protein
MSPLWLRDEEAAPEFTILETTEEKHALHGLSVKLQHLDLGPAEGSEEEKPDSDDDDDDVKDLTGFAIFWVISGPRKAQSSTIFFERLNP